MIRLKINKYNKVKILVPIIAIVYKVLQFSAEINFVSLLHFFVLSKL